MGHLTDVMNTLKRWLGLCNHQWGKWVEYKFDGYIVNKLTLKRYPLNEMRRKRECQKCNVVDDRLIETDRWKVG